METIFTLFMMLVSQLFGGSVQDVHTSDQGSAATDDLEQVTEIATVTSVVDGDTIKVMLDGREETVRYIGIDTPEPYRDGEPACYSAEATKHNRTLVSGREVRLVADTENRDRFDRLLRYVYVDDVFVQDALLRGGYATTLTIKPNVAFEADLAAAAAAAKSAGAGLWSACSAATASQTDQTTTATQTVQVSQLSEGQKRILQFLGINESTFVLTADMIACAGDAVGTDRLFEITTGTTPTIAEGIKLISCYKL